MTHTHLIHDLQDSRGVSLRIICSRRVNTAIERPDAHERIRFETVPEYRSIIVLEVEVYIYLSIVEQGPAHQSVQWCLGAVQRFFV